MKKLILVILFLPSIAFAQWSGVWVSGGGADTTGIHASIVHNATLIRGKPVTLIPPTDNQILKFNSAEDSLKFETDVSTASGTDSVFISVTAHDADTDTLFIKPSGFSGTNTFAAGTRVLVYKDGATELFGIDSLGAVVTGIWSATSISDANVDNNITIDLATAATTLTITDNEATSETNAIIFTAGGDLDGGDLGLESDGDLTYNPGTGNFGIGNAVADAKLTIKVGTTANDTLLAIYGDLDTDNMTQADSLGIVVLQDGGVGIGTFAIEHTLEVVGHVGIGRTATANDQHALEINADGAGFGDFKVIDVIYTTGALAAGEEEAIVLVNIDEIQATGGAISAFEVLSTEGSATVYGLKVGALVNPIIQLSGVFVNADTVVDNNTNVTTALSQNGAGNIAVFTADNDSLVVGSTARFEELELIFGTVSSGAGIAPTFEFSTGDHAWTAFTPTDGTNGAKNNGEVQWDDANIGAWSVGTGGYFQIKITRTRNTITTTPVLDSVRIAAVTLYTWDKDGDLDVNSIVSNLYDASGAVDLDVGSGDVLDVTVTTDGGDIVLDGNITQDAGTTLFMGGLLDATGAVDMDYGSSDITDHTFISDGTTDADFVVPLTSIGGAEIVSGDIGTTQIGTDGVSADELNATGVEAELEAVLDLPELQGLLLSIQVDSVGGNGIVTNATGDANYQPLEATLTDIADGTIAENLVNTANPWADNEVADDISATSYLLLANVLDTLDNYDNDIVFTQGLASYAANSVSADELNATGVETELEAVLDLPELQGLLLSIQVDSVGGNGIVTNATGDAAYLQLSAILDTLDNHDGAVLFTQGNTALAPDAVTPAILDDGSDTPADEQLLSYESTGDEVNYQDIVDFVTAGNRIQITGTTNITIASADTGEIQLPAALWDTTASSNGTLDFLETGAYRIKYWEYAASTQDTLLMTCDVNFTIPQDFGSWIDVKFEYENESTGADTLIMRMEGIAHDEAHAADLVIGSAADTLVSATGPAANDLRQGTAQTSITGTFAPEDHVHLILYRPATDAGVMRFLKLTFRYLKS